MSLRHRTLGPILALALAGQLCAAAPAAPATVEQMERLIRYLSQRIQEEDPAASPESTRYALFESLEMMGIEVPESVRQGSEMDTTALARALLGSTAAPTAPATPPTPPATTAPTAPVGPMVIEVPEATPAPPSTPPARVPAAVSPTPREPVTPRAAPLPAIPDATRRQLEEVVRAFPGVLEIPPYIRPRTAPPLPGVASMARAILENPTANPYRPTLKPVGRALAGRLVTPEPEPGPEQAPVPAPQAGPEVDSSDRIAELLSTWRARRRAGGGGSQVPAPSGRDG